MSENIWEVKIGGNADSLPMGADSPMRNAVRQAFTRITGNEPDFIFSGWAGSLTAMERAVVENRQPSDEEIRREITQLRKRADILESGLHPQGIVGSAQPRDREA